MRFTHFFPAAALAAALFTTAGCQPQAAHPGQINRFDGLAFDALTLTHGALVALRAPVAADYPQLAISYNRAVDAYAHAVTVYGLYRTASTSEMNATLAVGELVTAFGLLEADLESNFQIQLHTRKARAAQRKLASRAAASAFTLDSLFGDLQIAATIAAAITGDSAQVQAAQVILAATREAFSEWNAAAGKPVNLGVLGSLSPIGLSAGA